MKEVHKSMENILLALTIANRLLALVAAAREGGGGVSDEQLDEALTKALSARDRWYSRSEGSVDDPSNG